MAAEFIVAANASDAPILSLDVPSGCDGTLGEARAPCIRANATLTLALPKLGMMGRDRSEYVGRLLCADISCPKLVFADLGLTTSYETPFSKGPVIEPK
ncbi:NAD(P)H-hydrate epimerase [Octadecabacter antarcticus]|uniref:NAD(P)H-hydrate epimerase n=1 Tax=Octadecabacter antarcticus TaxID=1217908 RepID=UPI000A05092E